METTNKFKNSPIHDKAAVIEMLDNLEPKDMIKVVAFIQEQIKNCQTHPIIGNVFLKEEEDELQVLIRKIRYKQATIGEMKRADELTRKKWDRSLTFEECLREEFLVNTQNYPKEYFALFHQKYNRARNRFENQ